MPKDEFDFEDPFELNGVGLVCEEDTTEAMTECFVEEFMRLGYNHKQILALFRNPHYIGMNMALQNRGEPFVRDKIAEVFARWGRPVVAGVPPAVEPGFQPGGETSATAEPDQSRAGVPPAATEPGFQPGGETSPTAEPDQSRAGVPPATAVESTDAVEESGRRDACPALTDPMGAPLPDITI